MKKLFLVGALALFGAMNAQEGFKIGAHVGFPTGDAGDAYNFKLGLDAAYMFGVADNFTLGIASGYQAWLGKSISFEGVSVKVPTASMIPLAAAFQYNVSEKFAIGSDLGYGFIFSDGENDGGFYYQPKISYKVGENGAIWAGYSGLALDGATFSAVNLGYSYNIAK